MKFNKEIVFERELAHREPARRKEWLVLRLDCVRGFCGLLGEGEGWGGEAGGLSHD